MVSGSMGKGEGHDARLEEFAQEAVAAVFSMTNAADLEHRMRVLRTRSDIPDERLMPIYVVIPEGYDKEEIQTFMASITEALEKVCDGAHRDVMMDRTIKTMKDLGLGDGRENGE